MTDNQPSERAPLNYQSQNQDEKPAPLKAVVPEEAKKDKDAGAADQSSSPKRVSYFQLFKYTTIGEKVLICFAILLSTAHGVVLPLFCVAFGDITSDLTPNKSVDERSRLAAYSALMMFLCAAGNMITAGLAAFFWGFVGNRLQVRLRKMYFAALTAQEIEYFDLEKAEVLSTRYLTDMRTFQSSQGKINHTMLYPVSMTVSGLILGFVRGWWYSLIVTLLTPLVVVGMVIFVRSLGKEYAEIQKSYEQAGSVAEQALSSIRTVKTLNGEQYELSLFAKAADAARLISTKYSIVSGFSFGLFFCIIHHNSGINFMICYIHVSYSLNLWLGAVLIDRQVTNTNMDRAYAVSDICWIFFAIINGAFAIGHTSPAAKAIMTGAEAAYRIYEIIERKPLIEIDDQTKLKPTAVKGVLEFKGVSFSYKSKVGGSTTAKLSSKPALSQVSFRVNPGERVAFVGESGSGKSTTLIKNSPLSADDTCTLEDWTVPTLPRAQVESGSPDIVFENVSFTYPGREVKALDNLSFSVSPGEKVGIAGQSGSGKSTIFALLFRFYEVQSGRILVGGKDIKSIPVNTLRAQLLGMVQQEAILFSRTILDNIKYNLLDATDEQVVKAATVAEADSFIRKNQFEDQCLSKGEADKDKESSLPEGYFRQLGLKGSGISGGQKQRVAIARTVLRDPRVYLFDESTSALDSATENLVQTAFNKITVEKTSLTIAHRLSTIQNSDKILVIENGQLTEQGSYQTLVDRKGAFFQMLAHYQK